MPKYSILFCFYILYTNKKGCLDCINDDFYDSYDFYEYGLARDFL